MKTLSLENINKQAPYGVRHREKKSVFFCFLRNLLYLCIEQLSRWGQVL